MSWCRADNKRPWRTLCGKFHGEGTEGKPKSLCANRLTNINVKTTCRKCLSKPQERRHKDDCKQDNHLFYQMNGDVGCMHCGRPGTWDDYQYQRD